MAKQFAGWPITIDQQDNYGRKAVAHLPKIVVRGEVNPLIQVKEDATGEVIYTIRIDGTEFTPKVFSRGSHTVTVGEGRKQRVLKSLESGSRSSISVSL